MNQLGGPPEFRELYRNLRKYLTKKWRLLKMINRRHLINSFAASIVLISSSCASRNPIYSVKLIIPVQSRDDFLAMSRAFASTHGLEFVHLREHEDLSKNTAYVIKGKGVGIYCANDAYDLKNPYQYKIFFHKDYFLGMSTTDIDKLHQEFVGSISKINNVKILQV